MTDFGYDFPHPSLRMPVLAKNVVATSNGIGSDAFAILWDGHKLHGLNASGRSPAALTPGRFLGKQAVPFYGWDAATVPGPVSA